VIPIVLWYLDSGCSKHMTRDRSQLTNFVYYVEGLGHNLLFVGQFCDSNLEVAFCQHTYYVRDLKGVDLLTGSQGNNLYTLSLGEMMASSPICLLLKASKTKSWLWHRCLSHLNFGAINHLARQSLVRGKLQPKADIGIFISYAPTKKAFRIYNRRTHQIIETIHVDFDELTAVASKQSSLKPALHELTPATLSSRLVLNLLLQHPPEVVTPIADVAALELAVSTGSPSSKTVDKDAPSASNSQTTPETQSPFISNDIEDDDRDLDVAHMSNDLFFGILIPENDSESSSTDVIHTVVHTAALNSEHITK
nr:integrase, catalytic region, zinc finger, CCHC-type, peptidase aspartic, catalytic [Tanacetum cinerariifolium]